MTTGDEEPDAGATDAVDAQRGTLRRRGRAARAALTAAERLAATAVIVDRLATLPEIRRAHRVMLTRAIGGELDLEALERRVRAAGATVALPVIDGTDLVMVDVDEQTPMRPGWRDIPEPVGPPADGPPDVVVVPALAVDVRGERLGYGGGYYDRFLSGPADGAARVGAVFAVQVVPHVPRRPHDVPLDVVVTEEQVWRRPRPTR